MPGPRSYSVGTRAALVSMAGGTCYFPGCRTPTIAFLDGEPLANFDIAHIRDARPGNRFVAEMTDVQRAHFSNLILLCRPHHTLVDKTRPGDFSIATLESWKHAREGVTLGGGTHPGADLSGMDLETLIKDAVSAGLGMQLPLEPATLTPPPGAMLSPYQVLWPRFGIVPFQDHAGAVKRLEVWCADDSSASAAFIDGVGGAGKTRSAIELCSRQESRGWLTGFFRFGTQRAVEALSHQKVDQLIVFDYANDRPHQVSQFLEELLEARQLNASLSDPKLRLLLITRESGASAGDRTFSAHQKRSSLLLEDAQTVALSHPTNTSGTLGARGNFGISARQEMYRAACDAIGDHAGARPHTSAPPDLESDTYSVPLFVVLAAILASYDPTLPRGLARDDVLRRILDREASLFWSQSPEPDPDLRARAVCVPTIAPSPTDATTMDRLASLGYSAGSIETRRMANWLRSLYPGSNWANPLEPDLLGEYLLSTSLDATLASSTVAGALDEASTALRVLGRVLGNWPGHPINGALVSVCAVLPPILEAWLSQERNGNKRASDALEAASILVDRLPLSISLPHVNIPGRVGPGGNQLAVSVARRSVAQAALDDDRRAIYGRQCELAERLSRARCFPDALIVANEALASDWVASNDEDTLLTTIRLLTVKAVCQVEADGDDVATLRLALTRFDALDVNAQADQEPLHAAIQAKYANALRRKGLDAEALAVLERVVPMRRRIVRAHGAAHLPALAASLRTRATLSFASSHLESASDDISEAIAILRDFITRPGSLFQRDLAKCLDLGARILSAQNLEEAAVSRVEEAIRARRRLALAFGVDARLELLSSLVKAATATNASSVAYMTEAEQLITELDSESTISAPQLLLLAQQAARLAKRPAAAGRRDELETLAARIEERYARGLDDSPEAVALHLRFARRAATAGDLATAVDRYRRARKMGARLGTAQFVAVRLRYIIACAPTAALGSPIQAALEQLAVDAVHELCNTPPAPDVSPRTALGAAGFLASWINSEGEGGGQGQLAMAAAEDLRERYVVDGAIPTDSADTVLKRAMFKGAEVRSRNPLVGGPATQVKPRGDRRLTQSLADNEALKNWNLND